MQIQDGRGKAGEYRVDVRQGSAQQRVTAWRHAMSPTGEIEINEADAAHFRGELRSRVIGSMMVIRLAANTFRFARNEAELLRIGRDHMFINLVERGRVVGQINKKPVAIDQGGIFLSRLDGTQDLEMQQATLLGLVLPRQLVEKHVRWPSSLDVKKFEAQTTHAVLLGHHLRALMELPLPVHERDVKHVMRVTIALLTGLLGAPSSSASSIRASRKVDTEAIRQFIAKNIGNPNLGPQLVCKEFAISRSSLYRIFRETEDGGGIQSIVLADRLNAVHRDIASGRFAGDTIKMIAERRGVGDLRGFRRSFVARFGLTPADLRKLSNRKLTLMTQSDADAMEEIEHWFQA